MEKVTPELRTCQGQDTRQREALVQSLLRCQLCLALWRAYKTSR